MKNNTYSLIETSDKSPSLTIHDRISQDDVDFTEKLFKMEKNLRELQLTQEEEEGVCEKCRNTFFIAKSETRNLENYSIFSTGDEKLIALIRDVRKSLPLARLGYEWDTSEIEEWLLVNGIESFDKKDITDNFLPFLKQCNFSELIEDFKKILEIMNFLQLDFITVSQNK